MVYLENSNKQRFYLLFVQQDLFEIWELVRSFGSLINRRGRTIVNVCQNKIQALDALQDIELKKLKRGYHYAEFPNSEHFYLRPQNAKDIVNNFKNIQLNKPSVNTGLETQLSNPDQQQLF